MSETDKALRLLQSMAGNDELTVRMGTVVSLVSSTSMTVEIEDDVEIPARRWCQAKVGDRVLMIVSGTRFEAVGVLGGGA